MNDAAGVVFPVTDGRRSTTVTGRAIVADALRDVDPVGAMGAERETAWRTGYVAHFRRLVQAGLPSPEAARRIAADGLASVHDRMRWASADGNELPLGAAFDEPGEQLATEVVQGRARPDPALVVPHHGRHLSGDDLRRQLDVWVDLGVVEPDLGAVIGEVIEHPEWLRLEGRTVVALGAGAEMGPLRSLLRWGATVAAVDLPRTGLWADLVGDAQHWAGRLLVPVRPGPGPVAERAGADLLREPAPVARWVASLGGPLVLGNYVYADGGTNVRLSTAVDLLTEHVRAARDDAALAFLATPTDVFAVPDEAVAASVAAYRTRRVSRVVRVPLRTISGGRLLKRNYVPGVSPGLNDSVVVQQGPNYLLAKRIQRWRATTARGEGATVSMTVAPPTRTRSVLKNRALAAAYAGAHRFGVEVFEPGTSNTLMAAVLVHELCAGRPGLDHPWRDEAYAAAHGGLWRTAYDPRSALGLAALLGVASAR